MGRKKEVRIVHRDILNDLIDKLGLSDQLGKNDILERVAENLTTVLVTLLENPSSNDFPYIPRFPQAMRERILKYRKKIQKHGIVVNGSDIRRWFSTYKGGKGAVVEDRDMLVWIARQMSWREFLIEDDTDPEYYDAEKGGYWRSLWGEIQQLERWASISLEEYLNYALADVETITRQFYKTNFYLKLEVTASICQKCILIGDVGSGKTTALTALGYSMASKGWKVRYLSMNGEMAIQINLLLEELNYVHKLNDNYLYIVDNCHCDASMSFMIIRASKDYRNIRFLFSSRPTLTQFQISDTHYSSYLSEFSDEETVFGYPNDDDAVGMAKTYVLGIDRYDTVSKVESIHGNILTNKCGKNLKILRFLLEVWHKDGFRSDINDVSMKKVYAYLSKEYFDLPKEKGACITDLLKVAIFSQFDLSCVMFPGFISPAHEFYVRNDLLLKNRPNQNDELLIPTLKLHHATTASHILKVGFEREDFPFPSKLHFYTSLLVQYIENFSLYQTPYLFRHFFDIFELLYISFPKKVTENVIRHPNVTAAFKAMIEYSIGYTEKDNLQCKFIARFIKTVCLSETGNEYREYLHKIEIQNIAVTWQGLITNYRIGFELAESLLELVGLEFINKVNFQKLGSSVEIAPFTPMGQVLRYVNNFLERIDISLEQKQALQTTFLNNIDFRALGEVAMVQTKSDSIYYFRLFSSLRHMYLNMPNVNYIKKYMQGFGYTTLGDYFRTCLSKKDQKDIYYPTFSQILTYLEPVMDYQDAHDFISGFSLKFINEVYMKLPMPEEDLLAIDRIVLKASYVH